MVRSSPISIAALSAVVLLGLPPGDAAGQPNTVKQQLVGTWTFVSTTGKLPDGSPTWGSKGPPDLHRQRPLFLDDRTRRCSKIRGEEPLAGHA
jgi:hypothetical protein